MTNLSKWSEWVHRIRLKEDLDVDRLEREVQRARRDVLCSLRAPGMSRSKGGSACSPEELRNLLLVRLAVKEAYSADPEEDSRRLAISEYVIPLRELGWWNETTPEPDKIDQDTLDKLSGMLKDYPGGPDVSSNRTLAVLSGTIGAPQSRELPGAIVFDEELFGPDNSCALARESNYLLALYEEAMRATQKSLEPSRRDAVDKQQAAGRKRVRSGQTAQTRP